jgi:hypothetical protein
MAYNSEGISYQLFEVPAGTEIEILDAILRK